MPELRRTGGAKRGVGETRAMIADLEAQGLTVRQIAAILGLSTQAVYQHLQILRGQRRAQEAS